MVGNLCIIYKEIYRGFLLFLDGLAFKFVGEFVFLQIIIFLDEILWKILIFWALATQLLIF